ncbi:MAG TPA: hypothetical protein VFE31_11785 [Opitutaceae bacterium]|jgi:NDP-sugar pyrophosphorylase family protein|nr:hypothetical protein [Opitutaceae bacterium]
MKTLLICPARRPAVSILSEDLPLAALPILGESLAAHWVEYVAALGAKEVRIVAPDRADAVRAAVGDGGRWGVRIEIIAAAAEATAIEAATRYRSTDEPGWLPYPHDFIVMNHLPGAVGQPLFDSYAAWFSGVRNWMPHALTPVRVRVSEVRPGVWVGRRSRVHPTAQLHAPCWVGDQAYVGRDAIVGPGSVIENRAVVEQGARVIQSIVCPDTYVGKLTSVANSIASGNTLTNWKSGSSLRVPDPFLMTSLARKTKASARVARRSLAAGFGALAPWNLVRTWNYRLSDRTSSVKPPI